MVNIDQHKEVLIQLGTEMFDLCGTQLENSIEAFLNLDKDLAEMVIHMEYKMNALDLKIGRDCEQFLVLHKPVASDLRFVLALRKINFDLESIGDYAFGISKFTLELNMLPDRRLLKHLRIDEMFSHTISMLEDIREAYADNSSQRAHKVFKKEQILNEINNNSISVISKLVRKDVQLVDQFLMLYTVIKKLERVGDLTTNIAQEIIFYREAEVLKHQKEKFLV
ncbi:phosphate transport system regulatory protein PhoU [Salinimicrobium marinum]|uniref:Phosphate-specific transport system accessory protein PhoU n=1 Tax=Salinimicrobium marinum TaxID=680283 RepID=A0A918SGY5_9FLAO|nr:phosphate signaling complex protein PhoU [Salinimicrobium marinum]GHA37948.1 phosphate transport system regulatory protein PhoU [Salinimicrobium marinum]